MLINIHDSHLEKVGFLDSESPGAPGFFNDVEHHYLAEGASTFTFSVNKKKNGILQDYCQFLNEDAYFSFSEHGDDHFYSVGTVDEDNDTTFTVTCYSLNLELRLEQCDPLENTASHNIQWYFDQMGLINNTQIKIGINEVSDLSRVIKYDGQESKLARLISLIGNFDAEFEFITKSNNDGTLDKIILNIYKQNDGVNFQGVGTNRDDVILTLDTNITGVSRTVDKTQIFNATTITGADGLTWNSSEFSYVNSDGVEEFYKRKNADTAFAPLSLAKYPSQIQSSTGDRWIRKNFTTDYTSANAIWGYAVSQFKKFAYGIVTYKVSVSSLLVNSEVGNGLPLKIGDTVTISDDNFIDSNGVRGLILSARVSEMEISRTDPTKNTLVFSNYIRLQSQISNDLQSQLSNLVDAATPYIGSIDTTNGTQFKNGTGSTTLSAHIFKGSATAEATADSYEWSKDGTVVANAQAITVDASGVADKAVYSFKATVAGKVVGSQSVTITNVDDGTNGRSVTNVSQKWRLTTTTATPTQAWSDAGWLTTQPTTTATNKYLWSITRTTFNLAPLTQDVIEQKAVYGDKGDKGDTGNDGRAGKDGVGLRSTTVTYTISSSGTVTPTAGWNSQVPTLVKGQYLWTKTVWNYSDGTSESGYTVSYIAKDGNNGNDGIAGKDGVGITATTITYAQSTSGTIAPSSGWTSTVPTVAEGSYLWTKTVWTYSDSTSETGYSVAMNGKTPYFYTAWSYSADGTDGFTTVYPNLNLLVNSSAKTKDGFFKNFDKVEDGYGEVTLKGNNSYAGISMWDGFSIQPGDYKPGDTYTMSMDVMFTSWNFPAGVYLEEFWIGQRYTHNSDWSINSWKRICYIDLPKDPSKMLNQWIRITYTSTIPPHEDPSVHTESIFLTKFSGSGEASFTLRIRKPKQEPGSTATPHMPSASEVTTADWPSYIGQYTDFTQADSTKPSDYTWSLIRGNDGKDGANGKDGLAGKDGVGIKTTVITYAISISGTIAPTTGWTSSVPSLVKGQYLWTKTVWTYTDNSFETGYSVTYISKDGNNGNDGIAGKDGTGIKTTTITYAGSTSGTTAPTSGWTSTVPMVEAGSYLWTKTVWAYTDNTSETGYSVAKMGSDGAIGPQGPQGNTGPQGPAGSNGDPGKVVSDTEPTTRFKGLTWKYSGTSDLTASDGTVIHPNTEYYYNGTHWMINYLSANNLEANSITADLIDAKNLKITDGEFVSTTTNGLVTTSTEIKDNHIAISKKDGTVNTRNDIALDSEQGLAQKFTNINTGFYRTAGINYQGPFTSDSDGNYAQLTPQGTKLSTDVPWTKLSLMNNFNGNIEYAIINGTVYISASGVGVPAMTAGQWKQAAQLPTGSSAIPIRANRIAAGDSGDGLSWALLSNQAGGIFIRCSANKAPTPNLFNATLPYPIG
ncbi:collagen-like protein [Lactococcus lactis]|uniref:collagen-like protein n=2 Tax=Lactococcus lactis TaxID=1358 RepID=UPI0021518490|nr:collagen-like protein [Lactococcus lactis]UUY26688.1 collagen-like protein [Lactococcus lactis]